MKNTLYLLCILLGFAGGGVWLFYEPFRPDDVFRPIPAHTGYLSVHESVSSRWDDWLANPLTQSLLTTANVDPDELRRLHDDPGTQFLMQTLASRKVVVAYLPVAGVLGEPAWVFSSWLGGRAAILRWMLHLAPPIAATRIENLRGVDVWMLERAAPDGPAIYFALHGGMLIGAAGADPGVIAGLLDRMDFGNPGLSVLQSRSGWGQACGREDAPDRGWVDPMVSTLPDGFRFSLTRVNGSSLEGTLCAKGAFASQEHLSLDDAREASRMSGLPESFARLISTAPVLLDQLGDWLMLDDLPVPEGEARPVWLGVQGDSFSGRFLGIRIPSLLGGIRLADETEAHVWVGQLMDALNAAKQWGLVPRVEVMNGYAVTMFDSTIRSPYSLLPSRDKPGYMVMDGWLIFASHSRALVEFAARRDAVLPQELAFLPEQETLGHVWVDLTRLDQAAAPILQMLRFRMLLDRGADSQVRREQFNELEAWLKSIRSFQEGRISLHSEKGQSIMNFKLGADQEEMGI